jgi:hypothetical protein
MSNALEVLMSLYQKHHDEYFKYCLGECLAIACEYYGKNRQLKNSDKCLNKLRDIFLEHPQDLRYSMAKALLNTYYVHSSYDLTVRPKLLNQYRKQLRQLYEKYPEAQIAECLGGVLVENISQSAKYKREVDMANDLKELREI